MRELYPPYSKPETITFHYSNDLYEPGDIWYQTAADWVASREGDRNQSQYKYRYIVLFRWQSEEDEEWRIIRGGAKILARYVSKDSAWHFEALLPEHEDDVDSYCQFVSEIFDC